MRQPITYTLTDAEAAAAQSAQMARQAAVARRGPALIALSFAVPVLAVGFLFATDWLWYGGEMPAPLFLGLLAAFVAGMFTQTLAYKLTLASSTRRMRQAVRQVFASRTVRLTEAGLEHTTPDARTLYAWNGIDRAEEGAGLILIWAGHALASAVPVRAFSSAAEAQAFLAECRSLARGGADAVGPWQA
jgi:hypothetical protein